MKYVACYCRVSTDEQKKFGFSIQAQKDALEKYCKENGYKYEFYIDEGISASSMKKRRALKEMLNKSDVFDMILFTKLDRLSRNVLDANNIHNLLKENDCTMKALYEEDVDTATADGLFMFNLKVSLAQREIEKTSERIRFIFDNKREKGEVTSGTVKYGYKVENRKLVINKEEAENLRNLYKYFVSVNGSIPETYSYFTLHFNNKGYDAMRTYLRETAYIGKYKLYRKEIYIDNYAPRIIDDDLFNKVQNLLQKKQKYVHNDTPSLFSGLVYCQHCNSRMTKKQDNRVKNRLIRYSCDNVFRYKVGSNKRKCDNGILIREDNIEAYLLTNLKNELIKYKANVKVSNSSITKNTSKVIQKTENKISKLKDLYLDDLIDKENYTKDYKKYSTILKELKTSTNIIDKRDFSKVENILNSDYVTIYKNLSIENRRRFWLSIIDKISVESGKIREVTFL